MDSRLFRIVAVSVMALLSCGKISPERQLEEVEPSYLFPFPQQKYILKNAGENDPVLMTAVWTETVFRSAKNNAKLSVAPVTYSIQIDNAGEEFDTPVTIALTNETGVEIKTREFNLALLDSLHIPAGEAAMVDFRILTSYGQNDVRKIPSSNIVTLEFIPYQDRDPLQMMYISGDMNGWETTNAGRMLPMFKDNSEITNHVYSFVGYLPAGCRFKLFPQDYSDTNMVYGDAGNGVLYYGTDGESFVCQDGGYKRISINLRNMVYSVEDYDVSTARTWTLLGFIGSFCNWGNEPLMSHVDSSNPHIWHLEYSLPELGKGEVHSVKFRAERSWTSRWAALSPDDTPFGKTIFLEHDEADPNIVLYEGGRYDIWFNDMTGHYAIIKR